MTVGDDLVPVRPTQLGRMQQFIVEVLQAAPGRWHLYPHPVTNPDEIAWHYTRRHPGTDWATDRDSGRLIARWVGE